MCSRFNYVKYDEESTLDQSDFKSKVEELEYMIDSRIKSPRAKALAFTKLEEVYMWIGKGIRDDQIERTGKVELQEDRTNS